MEAMEWLERQYKRYQNRYQESYNTATRYRNQDLMNCVSECMSAYKKAKAIEYWEELNRKCYDKYGESIAAYLKL